MWTSLLEAPCGQVWVHNSSHSFPQAFVHFTSSRSPVRSSVWVSEKNAIMFLAREGERNHFKICQSTLLFLSRPVLKRKHSAKASLTGFFQHLTSLEKGKCPTPAPSSYPVPPKRSGGDCGAWVKFTAQGHRLTKGQRLSHNMRECFPSHSVSPPHY